MLLIFSLVALPFSATGGGRAPSPLPPPSVVEGQITPQQKKKQMQRICFFFCVILTE